MTDIIERLRIKSNMINMGESIQFGSETALMDEAAETIETLRAANKDSQAEVEKLKAALESIAANTCCDTCREAALVAQSALAASRDWPEDFSHENGNYLCRCCVCGNEFTGHKRRVECKLCYMKGASDD